LKTGYDNCLGSGGGDSGFLRLKPGDSWDQLHSEGGESDTRFPLKKRDFLGKKYF